MEVWITAQFLSLSLAHKQHEKADMDTEHTNSLKSQDVSQTVLLMQ